MNNENADISELSVNTGTGSTKEEVKEIKRSLTAKPPLLNIKVGLSSSESDDLGQLGLSELHLKDLVIEINRYFLSSGAVLLYGGDLRQGGLTELMIELVDRYRLPEEQQGVRLFSFLAYPLSTALKREQEAEYINRIRFIKVLPPIELTNIAPNEFLPPIGSDNLYVWAKSLTAMRNQMEENCDARIFIGGRGTNFKGRAPGLLEEILIALEHETPIFLIGSFGGVVADVIKHLNGDNQLVDTIDNLINQDSYLQVMETYRTNGNEEETNWKTHLLTRLEGGWSKISEVNKLSIEENKRLAESTHVHEIIYYLLKGIILTNRPN